MRRFGEKLKLWTEKAQFSNNTNVYAAFNKLKSDKWTKAEINNYCRLKPVSLGECILSPNSQIYCL